MEIKEIYDTFFTNLNIVKIDDAYDLYKKKKYMEYIETNNIKCIFSQDNDLSYLNDCPFIQYLILPKEAERLDALYELKEVFGLKIYSSVFNRLDLSKFPFLKELCLICDEKVDLTKVIFIRKLSIIHYAGKLNFVEFSNLNFLEISNSKRIEELGVLPKNLQYLILDYCQALKNISSIEDIKLKELSIFDCNNIDNLEKVIISQKELISLKLYNKETNSKSNISSLSILNSLRKLKYFDTDYKILDYDLYPLKRLEDVNILRWYKKYNMSDSELLHKYVIVKTDEIGYSIKKVLLSSLKDGKNNPNIIWSDVNIFKK